MPEDPNKATGTTHIVDLNDEMRQSYLDYAMSVIVGRALPDVYDGLKPVHRRVLFAMHQMGNAHNKPYKKSAAVVGDVLGKYHPHGDSAVYDTLVRMAQPFSMRYTLIEGQGNFGSVDGDAAAAMRYTEVRMETIAEEMLADIDKKTVDFVPNYDGSTEEPVVFPTKIPNLLVNGASGIAVGMATNIPPHNLGEINQALMLLINAPDATVDDLMAVLPAPDFPTGGIIMGLEGVRQAYRTGRGKVVIRSRCSIEYEKDRPRIIVTEIPYLVNKARLLERIAELVREKKIEGISEIRDESNKLGIRVVIVLHRGEHAEILLNNLYRQTALQSSFSFNMVALCERQPKLLTLKEILEAFLAHRRAVITKRTIFLLNKTKARAHILEGLAVAVSAIDQVVATIKSSANPPEAKQRLMQTDWTSPVLETLLARRTVDTRPEDLASGFGVIENDGTRFYRLSERQAKSILDLQLHRLTQLESDKLQSEYQACVSDITRYLDILANDSSLTKLIQEELADLTKRFNDARRSELCHDTLDLSSEDLIVDEDRLITITARGYCKTQPLDTFRMQRRGGRGKAATSLRDEDYIEHLLIGSKLSVLLCFSNFGRVYWIKVHQLPEANRGARGKPLANLIPKLSNGESIRAVLSVSSFEGDASILMSTTRGLIKRCSLSEFSRPRPSGKQAITLTPGDQLAFVRKIDSTNNDVMLFTSEGRAVRFIGSQVRTMGRTARGLRGVLLDPDSTHVVGLEVVDPSKQIIISTEQGIGKRLDLDVFKTKNRGGKGVAVIPEAKRKSQLAGVCQVGASDEVMFITTAGVLIRMAVSSISQVGRGAQGVSLVNLERGDSVAAMVPIYAEEQH